MRKLPKITEEFKQQQQQAVLDAEVIYEFEQLLERKYPFIDVIPFVILILAATWGSFYEPFVAWVSIPTFLIVWLTYKASGNPNIEQKVTITQKGIIVSELELIPEGYFTILRATGYIVALICIVSVFYFGPMILIGAGAGALMSFQFTGAQNEPKVRATPFNDNLDYVLSIINGRNFKNGILGYTHTFSNRDNYPQDVRNFFSFHYSATSQQQAKMRELISREINIIFEEDLTHI
ncbi:hypothetical protein BS333_20595 [Vibrio azureus]|nr:hypothetical protein BS333_20595 [Vibrio azureus]